jgi:hypothetical protein
MFDEIVLLDHSVDATGPRSINCYLVNVQDFAAHTVAENLLACALSHSR